MAMRGGGGDGGGKNVSLPYLGLAGGVFLAMWASCGSGAPRTPLKPGTGGAGAAALGGRAGTAGGVGASGGAGGTTGGGGVGAATGGGVGGMAATVGSNGAFLKPPGLTDPPTAETAGVVGLRRLTTREYSNTVTDLLGLDPAQSAVGVFPDDDRVPGTGYLAPNSFSLLHTQLVAESAERLATAAMAAGTIPVPCTDPTPGPVALQCAAEFIRSFGRRAFRRPVTAEEAADLLNVYSAAIDAGIDVRTALAFVVSGMLQSPNFLYHWEIGDEQPTRAGGLIALAAHQVASRLSYLLWQSMPDEALLAAADANQLSTPGQVLGQATRLLADAARSKAGLSTFHEQWLRVDRLDGLAKDPMRFPTFTPALADAFGEELRLFSSSVLTGAGDGTLKTLLTSPQTSVNGRLGILYGATVPGGDVFSPIRLNPAERAGIFTEGAFLATNATLTLTDPVKRGAVVWQRLLCGSVDASTLHPADHFPAPEAAGVTNRDRYARLSDASCGGCHKSFDVLGFAFENYDAIGAYQTMDNGVAINASGEAVTPGGSRIPFKNAVDLLNALAANDEVKWCVTRQWFRYLLGRLDASADVGSMERAYRAGAAVPGYSIRDMLMATVQTMAFRFRAPSPGEM